jgi:hypothetical protein
MAIAIPETGIRIPADLGLAYAERAADNLYGPSGYRTVRDRAKKTTHLLPHVHAARKRGEYDPRVEAKINEFAIFAPRSMLRVYIHDPAHCRMLGEAWSQEFLDDLTRWFAELPLATAVAMAVMGQADWLDDHPEYRGLPGVAKKRGQAVSER